jgi:hypothetical protein
MNERVRHAECEYTVSLCNYNENMVIQKTKICIVDYAKYVVMKHYLNKLLPPVIGASAETCVLLTNKCCFSHGQSNRSVLQPSLSLG